MGLSLKQEKLKGNWKKIGHKMLMALALAVEVATTTTIATLEEEEEVNRKAKQCRIQFHPG